MASTIDKIKNDIIEAINASQRATTPYDTEAEIVRVDGNVAWVHIPGGATETPVALTINARKGDKVQVRVSNGGAWLMGNATAPPTDDAKANEADKKAAEAKYLAVDAVDAALKADIAAQDAVASAVEAGQAAQEAQAIAESVEGIAENAQNSANSAYNSAQLAAKQLSVVEDIIGVLDLIATNGVYALTQDTEIKANKWYFEVEGTAVTPVGTENPHALGWYEVDDGVYSLTDDTTVTSGKTYYTIVASPVTMPSIGDIDEYYELVNIDQTIQNYVSSHLVLVGDTLSLQNGATRLALSTNADIGLTFYNEGQQVAQYGANAVIGDPNKFHITITPNYDNTQQGRISFYSDAGTEVAYISGDQLFINKSVVIMQMDVGDDDGQWSWKIHKINGENNLYLKWLG